MQYGANATYGMTNPYTTYQQQGYNPYVQNQQYNFTGAPQTQYQSFGGYQQQQQQPQQFMGTQGQASGQFFMFGR